MPIFSATKWTELKHLTLPSNSSMQIYPSNSVTNFITQLPTSLFLDGDWEVELSEIQYPYTWNNIRSGKIRPTLKVEVKEITPLWTFQLDTMITSTMLFTI